MVYWTLLLSIWGGRHLLPCARIAWCGWGAVAEVRGWRVSARGTITIATLQYYNSVDPPLLCQWRTRLSTDNNNNSGYKITTATATTTTAQGDTAVVRVAVMRNTTVRIHSALHKCLADTSNKSLWTWRRHILFPQQSTYFHLALCFLLKCWRKQNVFILFFLVDAADDVRWWFMQCSAPAQSPGAANC